MGSVGDAGDVGDAGGGAGGMRSMAGRGGARGRVVGNGGRVEVRVGADGNIIPLYKATGLVPGAWS